MNFIGLFIFHSFCIGFLAYIREENGEWKEATLPAAIRVYNFENLKCGNTYQIYLIPFTSGGKGERSQILSVRTDGRGKWNKNLIKVKIQNAIIIF